MPSRRFWLATVNRLVMKTVTIPGWGSIEIKNVVLDLNGTITESGEPIPGILDYLQTLSNKGFEVYILSGDTRGILREKFEHISAVHTVSAETAGAKKAFVESIGPEVTVCIGNGNIDIGMFKISGLSICTIQAEGASANALLHTDIVVTHVRQAIDIILDSKKLIATLRR